MDLNENIIVYGFDEELDFIESIVPWKGTAILDTDCTTDLIAIGCYASITNLSKIKDEELQILYDFYLDVLDPIEVPILIGIPSLPVPAQLSNVFVLYESIEKAKEKLKYDLLAAYRRRHSAGQSQMLWLCLRRSGSIPALPRKNFPKYWNFRRVPSSDTSNL